MSPAAGFEGLSPLLRLQRRRLVGRMRHGLSTLKQPKRLALVLLGLALVSLFVVGTSHNDSGGNPVLEQGRGGPLLAMFLTVFLGTTVVGAAAHGNMTFSPAEVQFLFPGPVGSRALICSHLVAACTKAFTGAVIFTLFLKPEGPAVWRVLFGYQLVFTALVALGLLVDLTHMHLEPAARKRRAWALAIGLLLAVTGAVFRAFQLDGHWSMEVMRWASLPGQLFSGLLLADDPGRALAHLAGTVTMTGALTLGCLVWSRPVRAGSLHASERMRTTLERMSKGGPIPEAVREQTDGRLLPMLPRWGGAGVHVWRQLSSLRRRRKAFGLLILVPLLSATTISLVGDHPRPEMGAAMAIVMLLILGPFYVQCDFRSDHQSLAWLRSLPTSATALAAGQLLASALVVTALQLLMGGWGLFVAKPDHLPQWLAGLALLPVLNVILLAVENAVWLVHPVRLDYRKGPPGALEIVRMYGVFLAKAVVMAVTLGLAVLPGVGVAMATGSPEAGVAVSAVALVLETALLVVIVGKLFRWVDPSRDLPDD